MQQLLQSIHSLMSNESMIEKQPNTLRLTTFNVNGVRTVFDYHPWKKSPTIKGMMDILNTDILVLQELKVARENITNAVGNIEGVSSYVTVPKSKRGYSGVGVYVRNSEIPSSTVIKAEEGVSGYLECPDFKLGDLSYRDVERLSARYKGTSKDFEMKYSETARKLIGGYPTLFNRERCLELDGQGRAVLVELASGLVVIGTYCPANSRGTEEGERFKLDYVRLLLERARSLEKIGKKVIVTGDINISKSAIDNAEGLDNVKAANKDLSEYAKSNIPRILLNFAVHGSDISEKSISVDIEGNILQNSANGPVRIERNKSLFVDEDSDDEDCSDDKDDDLIPVAEVLENNPFLYDTIRKCQGDKQRLYTCWNVQKDYRSINYGSRIDLILCSENLKSALVQSSILPNFYGSDHCPVYADFLIEEQHAEISSYVPRFNAKYMYNLNNLTILNMFKNFNKNSILKRESQETEIEIVKEIKKQKTQVIDLPISNAKYASRKEPKQPSISMFFGKKDTPKIIKTAESSLEEVKKKLTTLDKQGSKQDNKQTAAKPSSKPKVSVSEKPEVSYSGTLWKMMNQDDNPKCYHGKPCILKTSMTDKNKGKKFWTCRKVSVGKERKKPLEENTSCGFFQWA